jgi:glycosyltransferase involved in cell wall biosynthesis
VPSGYLAAFVGRLLSVPSYVSIRGNDIDRGAYSPRQFPFLLWTLTRADAVSTVSTELRDKARLISDRTDVEFVPNSVDADTFRPGPPHAEAAALRAGGSALIGFIGELRFKKGMPALLEALRRCRAARPVKLVVIGHLRRADRPLLREFLHDNPHLAPDIVQVPYVEDRAELAAWYNALDLAVCPSLWEGMPNTVLEAMACGRLVLASRTGGVPDVVEHDRDGYLIDRAQLDILDQAILEILDLPAERKQAVAQAAHRKILDRFAPECEFEAHTRIYRRLLSP